VPAFAPVRDAIASAALDGPDAVAAAVARFRGDDTLERLTYEPMVLADLAGQMFVRLVELAPGGAERHLASPVALPAFLRLPFDEAIDFFTRRGGDPALVDEVLRAYRRRSSQYTDDQLDTISRAAIAELQRTLDEGGTLQDFRAAIRDESASLGITAADPRYLENVYRTQVASAYGAGRWAQINSPDVTASRPYRRLSTAMDSRVSPDHALMQGVVWRHDNPAFTGVAPPFRWQCRCALTTASDADLAAHGWTVSDAPPAGFAVTPGFGSASFVR
jgi:SPP1 gp7 family putative phage head morphogenesis protein